MKGIGNGHSQQEILVLTIIVHLLVTTGTILFYGVIYHLSLLLALLYCILYLILSSNFAVVLSRSEFSVLRYKVFLLHELQPISLDSQDFISTEPLLGKLLACKVVTLFDTFKHWFTLFLTKIPHSIGNTEFFQILKAAFQFEKLLASRGIKYCFKA